MIKALTHSRSGPEIVLGLTHTNLDRLADDRPIRVQAREVDPHGVDFQVWLLGGPDPRAIATQLAAEVRITAPTGADVGGGWLQFTTSGYGAQMAILGIGDSAATTLRRGAEHGYLPEITGAPRIKILAGSTSDAIGARLTAGGYDFAGALIVDGRGGRND